MVRKSTLDVSAKAARILNLILVAFAFILVRIWYLAEVQYEERVESARKPREKIVMEPAKRGTIRDRFNVPLAINKIQYQVGIVYAELTQIPRFTWEKDASGNKVKRYKRKEYIRQLSELIGKEMEMDPERIDDLVHAKAALYYQIPFIINESISEEQYYRFNMLAKDWPGLHVTRIPKRYYPKGKVAADIIGYMGAINREEWDAIIQEIQELKVFLAEQDQMMPFPGELTSHEEVIARLKELEERAYTANDSIGKAGVEAKFEQQLRGFQGKKSFYSDARGNFLRELDGGRDPLSGGRLLLTISSELQEYAEKLLAQNETIREIRTSAGSAITRDPWVKGGAIVAMDPKTGEIVTMATFPRFDPNDFISNRGEISHWFETESYLGDIWNQKKPLARETFVQDEFQVEELMLTWNHYLEMILPKGHPVADALKKIEHTRNAILVQRQVERLLAISGQNNLHRLFNVLYDKAEHHHFGSQPPAHLKAAIQENIGKNKEEVGKLKKALARWFEGLKHNYDKVLLVDLLRLAVDSDQFDDALLPYVGGQSLAAYRDLNGAMINIKSVVEKMVRELYHEHYFAPWRKEHGASFMKEKRQEEKENKRFAKPYIDYFDQKESELFAEFWNTYQWRFLSVLIKGKEAIKQMTVYDAPFLAWHEELKKGAHAQLPWSDSFHLVKGAVADLSIEQTYGYLRTFRGFSDLKRPLYGRYRYLKKEGRVQREKHLAMAFYPNYGFGNARSFAYRQATTQGSLFKLVTGYAGMMQRYGELDGKANSATVNPLTIIDEPYRDQKTQYVGRFKGGKPIPQMYKGGRLAKTMMSNVGQVDMVGALAHSSNPYFSILAGDVLKDPMQLAKTARLFSYGKRTGIDLPYELSGRIPNDIDFNKTGLYSMAIGQHTLVVTPLQTSVMLSALVNGGHVLKPNLIHLAVGLNAENPIKQWPVEVVRQLPMPKVVQNTLVEGMRQVVDRLTSVGLGNLTQLYRKDPTAVRALLELKDQMVGKTSTAEAMENLNLDLFKGTNRFNHVWFGSVSFDKVQKRKMGDPELVVVVFLRYGSFGKEAAPLAAQIIKKWREIKSRATL